MIDGYIAALRRAVAVKMERQDKRSHPKAPWTLRFTSGRHGARCNDLARIVHGVKAQANERQSRHRKASVLRIDATMAAGGRR
jgi:hypothetical protein